MNRPLGRGLTRIFEPERGASLRPFGFMGRAQGKVEYAPSHEPQELVAPIALPNPGSWSQCAPKFWEWEPAMERPRLRQVLDCASPLALLRAPALPKAAEACRSHARAAIAQIWANHVNSSQWKVIEKKMEEVSWSVSRLRCNAEVAWVPLLLLHQDRERPAALAAQFPLA